MPVKPIPDGYTTVAPYLFVDDAKGAIEFSKRVTLRRRAAALNAPRDRAVLEKPARPETL